MRQCAPIWGQSSAPIDTQLRAGGLDRLAHARDLVGAHVIYEDDVALLERRHQHLLDIGEEGWAIHGAVDHVRGGHAVAAQGSNQRQRLPVAVRNLRDQSLADRGAAVEPGHLRRHRGLVDEHQARGLQRRLLGLQLRACGGYIGSVLLGRVQGFSLNVILWQS